MPLEGATKSTLLWASDKSCYTTRVEGGVVWCGPCDTLLEASATRCSAVCLYMWSGFGVVRALRHSAQGKCHEVLRGMFLWCGVVRALRHSAQGKRHEVLRSMFVWCGVVRCGAGPAALCSRQVPRTYCSRASMRPFVLS